MFKGGGGRLEDFENKIAQVQAGKQMSCRAKTDINPLQHLSVMDSKKKFCMKELLWCDISLLRVSKGTKSWTLVLRGS